MNVPPAKPCRIEDAKSLASSSPDPEVSPIPTPIPTGDMMAKMDSQSKAWTHLSRLDCQISRPMQKEITLLWIQMAPNTAQTSDSSSCRPTASPSKIVWNERAIRRRKARRPSGLGAWLWPICASCPGSILLWPWCLC